MRRESGCRRWPIWLVGDSSPEAWEEHLDEPLDPRHPARHSIWTPVLESIQRQVYRCGRRRVDENRLYVTNAVHKACERPKVGEAQWGPELQEKARRFGERLESHRPALVFTFGAFAFEFSRRGPGCKAARSPGYWTTERLGGAFAKAVDDFKPGEINVFPLLHVSIARGKFLVSHKNFTGKCDGNYFDMVGGEIGQLLCCSADALDIWVEP